MTTVLTPSIPSPLDATDLDEIHEGARECAAWLREDDALDLLEYHLEGVETLIAALARDIVACDIVARLPTERAQFGHDLYLAAAGTGAGIGDGRYRGILAPQEVDYLCAFAYRHEGSFM